jgi:hypothetical protein
MPPYAPDFNSIEPVFVQVKTALRPAVDRSFCNPLAATKAALDAVTPANEAGRNAAGGAPLPLQLICVRALRQDAPATKDARAFRGFFHHRTYNLAALPAARLSTQEADAEVAARLGVLQPMYCCHPPVLIGRGTEGRQTESAI